MGNLYNNAGADGKQDTAPWSFCVKARLTGLEDAMDRVYRGRTRYEISHVQGFLEKNNQKKPVRRYGTSPDDGFGQPWPIQHGRRRFRGQPNCF